MLWEMVTGHPPFMGSPAEVMYQHQHASLPLEQLKNVPQPVAVLFEVLLEKEPAQRFQTPTRLLLALSKVITAIEAGRTLTPEGLHKLSPVEAGAATRKPTQAGPEKISVARLPITGSDLFGREEDIAFLDDAWANQQANVITFIWFRE